MVTLCSHVFRQNRFDHRVLSPLSYVNNLALKYSNDKDSLPIYFVCPKTNKTKNLVVKSKKILLLLLIGFFFSQEWELTNQMSGLSYIILCQNRSKDITKNLDELDVTVDIPLVSFSMPMQTSKSLNSNKLDIFFMA